ncbi:MAG: dihydrofolate reductase family protein [Myxococcota bacterium]
MSVYASVFIATSLDGFIAREDGAIDWLPQPDGSSSDDHGYSAFWSRIDGMVMGRNTLEVVLSFGSWPYEDKEIVVLSHTLTPETLPELCRGKVRLHGGSLADLMDDLERRGVTRIYVDGGKTIQSFLAEGLLQELIITRIPVLIGKGLPLFGALPHDVALEHVETQAYPSGMVQSRYLVRR